MKRKRPSGGYTTYNRTYKKRRTYNGNQKNYRQFVPRTMGPFAASESKYFDSELFGATVPVASVAWTGTEIDPPVLDTLFCPTEGSDINNRVGRRVQVYKIAIRGIINTVPTQDSPDVLGSPVNRLILYIDKQTNGVQSQGEEVMSDSGSPVNSFQNPANFGRFTVLKDVVYRPRIVTASTDGTNTTTQNVSPVYFKCKYKFKKPIYVKFNATNGGSVGDIVDNSFHMIMTASNSNFAQTVTYQCRTYYKDI